MNLGRFFQRLALYRASRGVPLWVLVALALGFYLLAGIGRAEAACVALNAYDFACDLQTEAAGAQSNGNFPQASYAPYCSPAAPPQSGGPFHNAASKVYNWNWNCGTAGTESSPTWASATYTTADCPAPNEVENGQCVDPVAECLAKPPLGATFVQGASSVCQGGCVYQSPGDTISVDFGDGQGALSNTTGWVPSGGTCTTDNTQPATNSEQTCKAAPNGQTFCIKPDGKQCATASTGRQICWTPGETGEKYDANTGQRRNPGTDTTPPTPPPGETATPAYPPQTTTTNVNNTTVNTTLVTHTTDNGTNFGGPGSTDGGEAGDGTGGADGDGTSPAMEQLGEEGQNLDTGEGGEGIDGTTAWGPDEGGDFTPDEGGFGLTRACPAPPEVMGTVLDFAGLCTIMQYVGLLVLAAAHMHALYIIAGD